MCRNELSGFAWVLFIVVSLSFAMQARADVTGTIHGTVTDTSGATVSGAKVTLMNVGTGLSRVLTTDVNGDYEFLAVPIGPGYAVEVEVSGFSKGLQSNITLTVNQNFRADVHLAVGQVTEKVEVTASAVQVQTNTNEIGNVIESKAILAMPLNGRSYTDLLSLQPGVAPVTSLAGATERSPSGSLNPGVVSVNGARENGNSFLVNGGDVNESRDNGASIVPTLDAIAEFRVLTNNYDAEYGKFAGGIINVVTKSGTNTFHGDVFEFLRNDVLDARNYFSSARGNFKQNQFGGTLGGPILKNRLFFFSDYQGTRQVLGVNTGNVVVPSLLERSGDFSDTTQGTGALNLPSLNGVVRGSNSAGDMADTLTHRLGYAVAAGEPYWTPGCNTATCVFPGQMIPKAAWSPAAAGTLQFIPSPVSSTGGIPVWSSGSENQRLRDDKWGERIDLNSNQNSLWSFYYSFDDSSVLNPFAGGNVPGFLGLTPSRGQQANLRNSHSLGTLAVNTLTFNYTGYSIRTNLPSGTGLGKPSDFGFVPGGLGIIPTAPQYGGVPTVSLVGHYGASFGVSNFINRQANHTFQISDNYAKVSGKHTLTLGTDLRYFQINTRQNIHQNGTFAFDGSETGNDFADYLIGAPAPQGYTQASLQLQNVRTKYFSLFGQDSYKITPAFTLNYGLRWEASEPYRDTQGLIMTFVAGEQSKVFPNAPRGWVFPGDPGIPSTISPIRWHNFAPRLGVAYSPNSTTGLSGKLFGGPGKTSIRAGGGLFYTSFEELIANYMVGDAPFGNFYVTPVLIYFEEPFKSRVGTNDPGQRFPVGVNLPRQGGNPVSFAPYQPIASSQVWPTTNVLPYVEQSNFTIQREIANSTIATIGYVGTFGRHLIGQKEFNPGNPALCLKILSLYTAAGQASSGCGPAGEDTIYNINRQTFNGTRPYSVTSGRYLSLGETDFSFNPAMGTTAASNYQALQASLERKTGPLTFLAGYTYSKSMDDTSGFIYPFINPYNPRSSRALSAFNMTHNFVLSYTYALPFGHLASSQKGLAHSLLDGWHLSGITRFATGQPIPITQIADYSLCGCPNSDVDKPFYLGGPIKFFNPRKSPTHQFFSTDQFVALLETPNVPSLPVQAATTGT